MTILFMVKKKLLLQGNGGVYDEDLTREYNEKVELTMTTN